MALAPLFPEEIQFQAKNGRNLTAGWLNVYLAGTDDVAETFCDYGVTRNPQDIVLDDNGRAVVICESGVAYRLEVFDSEGTLLWTEEPIYCEGTGSGGSGDVEVESTDGSIYVSKTVAAGTTFFDLSTNTGDVPEMAEWGRFRAPAVSTPGALQLARVDGVIDVDTGVQLVAGNHYHVTTEIVVTPDGTGINYRTVTFELQDLDGNVLASRTDSVDTSTSEPVTPELSVDLYPTMDVEVVPVVSWDDDIASVEVPRMDVHRFYAGFRAIPNTVATKDWVNGNFLPSEFSGDVIPWSALEGTAGTITGISGSAVGTDYSAVSAIASSYAESAASGKLDSSAFSSYTATALSGIQQDTATISSYVSGLSSKVEQSAFDDCCSAMSAAVSSVSSDVSSLSATVSGLTGTYLEQSAFTAYTSTALTGLQQDTGSISAAVSGLSGDLSSYLPVSSIEGYAGKVTAISGSAIKGHEYTGIYPVVVDNTADEISVANTTLAVDETLSAYQSGNSAILGVVVSAVTSGLATEGYVDSAVSSKLDASASSQFITSLSGYATEGYVDSSVSGKLDTTAFSNVSGTFLTSVDLTPYQEKSGMSAYAYESSLSSKLDASASSQFITSLAGYATEGYVDSSVSAKLDATASSQFYLTSNPAGYITGVDLTPYQLTADMSGYIPTSESANYQPASAMTAYQPVSAMTAYQPSGDYAYNSSLSGYIPTSESSKYVTSLAGYATESYVDSAVSGKQDASAMTAYQLSGDYAYNSAVSGKQDSSAMTAYQEITGMTAYQPAGDYQPSGDYIYESALGWAEV